MGCVRTAKLHVMKVDIEPVETNVCWSVLPETNGMSGRDPYDSKGMALVDGDSGGTFPYYSDDDASAVKVSTDDTPRIWVGHGVVYPPEVESTQFDESTEFTDYAVLSFSSGVIYFLGKATSSVRYQGDLKKVNGVVSFDNSANSGTTGSSGFTRDNADQRTSTPNAADVVGWRVP